MVNLGDKVKDRINGFQGIVTGRAEYLYGCVQVVISPDRLGKDGDYLEGKWVDEDRVEVVNPYAAPRPQSADVRAGGPTVGPQPPLR